MCVCAVLLYFSGMPKGRGCHWDLAKCSAKRQRPHAAGFFFHFSCDCSLQVLFSLFFLIFFYSILFFFLLLFFQFLVQRSLRNVLQCKLQIPDYVCLSVIQSECDVCVCMCALVEIVCEHVVYRIEEVSGSLPN